MEDQPIVQKTPKIKNPTTSSSDSSPINQTVTTINGNNVDESLTDVEKEDYFNSFPPGYRFKPFDDELVVHYLQKKVKNQPLPPNKIHVVNLYRYNPETLTENYKSDGEEWYFFTSRDRKYRNGKRPNRAAGDGFWKATGADKSVISNGCTVGLKKSLVFYKGKAPGGVKTNWIMHEFRDKNPPTIPCVGMRLDDVVLCRIHKKVENQNNNDDKEPPLKVQKVQVDQNSGLIESKESCGMDIVFSDHLIPKDWNTFNSQFPLAYFNYPNIHSESIQPAPKQCSIHLSESDMRLDQPNQYHLGYDDEDLFGISKPEQSNYPDIFQQLYDMDNNYLDGI